MTVTITDATYDDPLGTGDFTLNGAPAGTTIDSVARDSATQATLTLLFDGTDFDTNASLSVTVLQAAFSPVAGPATTGTVTVTAVLESAAITGTNPASLTETNLNGADVTVTITNATYDDPLGTGDFTLNGAPAGTTISGVTRDTATQATLTLLFDGTDFDTNASMSVTVLQAAFSPVAGPETTGTVTVTTVVEADLQQLHYRWRNDNGGEGNLPTFDVGDEADGALAPTGTFDLNTSTSGGRTYADGIAYHVTAPADSATSVTRVSGSDTNGIVQGDELLLINMQGASTDTADVGNYEFVEVLSVSSGTITFTGSGISKSYDGTTASNQKVVVQRVPNYTSVTLDTANDKITASAWDGLTANPAHTGIVVFRASGTVSVGASTSIDVNGLGYRGGAGGVGAVNDGSDGGVNGESYDGSLPANIGSGGDDTATGTGGGNLGTKGGGGSSNSDPNTLNEETRGGGGGGGNADCCELDDGGGGAGGAGYGDGGGGGGGGGDATSGGAGGVGGTTNLPALGSSGGGGGEGGDIAAGGVGGAAGLPGGGTGNQGAAGSAREETGGGGAGVPAGGTFTGVGGAGGGGGGQYGVKELTTLFVGSGGGGGGAHDATTAVAGGIGGNGGGIIFVIADSVTISGSTTSITSSGTAGVDVASREGAGGGGSGGSILIHANSVSLGTDLVKASGGSGGALTTPGGGGGGGGIGRIRVEADTITASPVASEGVTPGGGSGGADWAADEDTALSALATMTLRRLRIEMSNEGGLTASGVQFRLEVSGALSTANPGSCAATSYLTLPTADWEIVDSTNLTDGTATTDVTDGLFNENTAFVAGQVKDAGNQTTGITLTSADFTEIEFALRAKATATPGALYCFRLTNAGSTTDFKDPYPKYAQATIAGVDNFSVEAAGGGAIGTQVEENPFSIQVTARDYLDATVTSFTGTVEITATGGTLSDGSGTTASFSSGLLASHSVTIADPGSVTITATETSATATGTSNSFTVNPLTSFLFRKEITIDRSKIPSGCGTTLPNFPLLFSVTHTDLIRDTDCATGVDGPCDAQGDDIVFRALDTVTCGGAEKCTLDHEIESYDGTTGTVVAWVRLPAVKTDSHTEDTKIYVYYGNSNVTSSTENVDGVWDVNYVGGVAPQGERRRNGSRIR